MKFNLLAFSLFLLLFINLSPLCNGGFLYRHKNPPTLLEDLVGSDIYSWFFGQQKHKSTFWEDFFGQNNEEEASVSNSFSSLFKSDAGTSSIAAGNKPPASEEAAHFSAPIVQSKGFGSSLAGLFSGIEGKKSRPSILAEIFSILGLNGLFEIVGNNNVFLFVDFIISIFILLSTFSLWGFVSVWWQFSNILLPLTAFFILYLIKKNALAIPLLYQLSYLCWLYLNLAFTSCRIIFYVFRNINVAQSSSNTG
ncbi:hypothetical protein MDAP_002361 [Mitosporidium daphniae]|uniref:Uncharacterized protein n=1 Tax=Mitosporidium daphniae TaxID=1485682 RepID=A0A098VMM4_9MICR|nr:uncharacterized protein DI09_77p120 [Mitosporidium daphniae]KGG50322.1 hypothetical protein DI09_77p120 [Mitosporidium daphniae]|eukprot:XP_013236749.1 uncharacterized protein DI09_77p120 [Mitosporidium daphniae]